jgi:hypothetical protein
MSFPKAAHKVDALSLSVSLCFQHVSPYASNRSFLVLSNMSLLMQHVIPSASNMSLLLLSTCHSLCFQHVTPSPYASNLSLLMQLRSHSLRGQHVIAKAINRWMTGRFVSSFCTSKAIDFHSFPFFQLIFIFKLVLTS